MSAALLVSVASVGWTLRIALAETWGESSESDRIAWAISLDPGNPELHYRMGMLNLARGTSFSAAVAELRRSVELNPRLAKYWIALARACFVLGDEQCAEQSFEQAVYRAPMMPSLEAEAATYYAAQGNTARMFAHARRMLELDPGNTEQVFTLASRAASSPEAIWSELVGGLSDVSVKCAYLEFLARQGRFDLAVQYWNAIANSVGGGKGRADSASPRLQFDAVRSYLQWLLKCQHYDEAVAVWQDLVHWSVVRAEAPIGENVLFNGSFEQRILNAGLDWQTRELSYVSVDFPYCSESPNARGSSRCLRIDFTAPHNAEYEPVFQLVPVLSQRLYRLSAQVRSEAVTSDSGPRLRARDLQCPACLDMASAPAIGTTGWHEEAMTFATGPQTKMVCISVWRPRSRAFPMDITGVLWLDSVSLRILD